MRKNKGEDIRDKALANAVRKGEISISDIPLKKRKKIKKVLSNTSKFELEKASRNKYRFSNRKVKHASKKKNESMEEKDIDFKKIITNIEDWDDKVKGGLAKDKNPTDYDLDDLSKGAEIQMEHTDDPEKGDRKTQEGYRYKEHIRSCLRQGR